MIPLFIWIGKSLLILAIYYYLLPPIVHAHTRNSLVKIPVMLALGIVAGIFMAWLNYTPFILFFVWLVFTRGTIREYEKPKFEIEAGMRINKPLFYWSSYSYVVLSCLLAWVLQMRMLIGNPNGPGILLWKYVLGLH